MNIAKDENKKLDIIQSRDIWRVELFVSGVGTFRTPNIYTKEEVDQIAHVWKSRIFDDKSEFVKPHGEIEIY